MKVLIIGLGSIAQKHITAIKKLLPQSKIIALRSNSNSQSFDHVENIYSLKELDCLPDFCIISTPTALHAETIESVISLKIPLFIEKPPFSSIEDYSQILPKIEKYNIITYVAFNLRFHPVIQWLKANSIHIRALEVNIYCGSYLPDWRKNQDYSKSYSAKKHLGGGVHLDLIHELDYTIWLWGQPHYVHAQLAKLSDLHIESADYAHYLLCYEDKYISITLNYYRRDSKRQIEIVSANDTWVADLIDCNIKNNQGTILMQHPSFNPITTYIDQMHYFIECLKTNTPPMNNLKDSMPVLRACLTPPLVSNNF